MRVLLLGVLGVLVLGGAFAYEELTKPTGSFDSAAVEDDGFATPISVPPPTLDDPFAEIEEMEHGTCAGMTWSELKAESGWRRSDPPRPDYIEAAAHKLEARQGWDTGPELSAATRGCVAGFMSTGLLDD